MTTVFANKFECKLTTRALLGIEKALGDNPINLLFKDDSYVPSLNVMLTILFYSARKYNPTIKSMDDIIEIYDDYLEDGGSLMGLAEFVMELFKDSGMMNTSDKADKEPELKN